MRRELTTAGLVLASDLLMIGAMLGAIALVVGNSFCSPSQLKTGTTVSPLAVAAHRKAAGNSVERAANSLSESPRKLPSDVATPSPSRGLETATTRNKPLMRSGTGFTPAEKSNTGGSTRLAGVPADRFLAALAQVESGNDRHAHGRAGERGLYQFRAVAWIQSQGLLRRARRIESAGGWPRLSAATDPGTARIHALAYLHWLERNLATALARRPEPPELWAAWNLGASGFRRRGFDLARCPTVTRTKARVFARLVR